MSEEFGERLVKSAEEALAIARGEMEPGAVYVPSDIDVAAIRKRFGLSQAKFASRFGFSAAAVRDWEQGRRKPESAARAYLMVIDREPEAVERALTDAV